MTPPATSPRTRPTPELRALAAAGPRRISVLGSTGSIGTHALEHVVEAAPDVGHATGGDALLEDVAVPETESCLESLHGVCPTSSGYGTRTAPFGMLTRSTLIPCPLGRSAPPWG